jgi:hypothetical protein
LAIDKAFKAATINNLGVIEASILFDFVDKDILSGEYYTRVPICNNHIRMDVVCIKGSKINIPISTYGKLEELKRYLNTLRGIMAWVLEIKEQLNFEALGQIIVDKHYFSREYPNISVEVYGILCRSNDKVLETVCKNFGISVFEILK